MGIYDRDYYRQEQRPGPSLHAPRTVVGAIIAVNVAVWIADYLVARTAPGDGHWLSDQMAVHVDTLTQPWLWWQFLTAGFTHSPLRFPAHPVNMLALFFLGRDVEEAYGPKEFLRLYLVMVVFASVVWNVVNKLAGTPATSMALRGVRRDRRGGRPLRPEFPRRTLLLFFVIPIPAWLFGVLMVGLDMFGASGREAPSNVAYSMHLAGAAFALVYYQRGWNLTRLTPGRIPWPSFRRKPRLRIHEPEQEPGSDLSAEVDRILEKIYREGEASLTAKERKTLETASREYQRKKRTKR